VRALAGHLRRRYGAGALHLAAHLVAFAIAGYALAQILGGRAPLDYLLWFAAAAVLHDIVFLPFYSLLDRAGHAWSRRFHGHPHAVPLVNHIRAPALISGLLLIVYAPLITRKSEAYYLLDTGHPLRNYTLNWLAITLALFAGSGAIYALRAWRRQRSRAPA
jgi:hypothetical protein